MSAAHDAERMVAEVRDDPTARIRLAADTYALRGVSRPYRPYRRAVIAFMRWQQARGVLNALDLRRTPGARGGGPSTTICCATRWKRSFWWSVRTVSRRDPSVQHWVDFFRAPSARSWYLAHNASVVGGYLTHSDLAALESRAERFFMNVVLVRVLFAHALVLDADLALGRFAFVARLVGHPRARGPQALLSMKDVLPVSYPIDKLEVQDAHRQREQSLSDGGLRGDRSTRRRPVRGVGAGPR